MDKIYIYGTGSKVLRFLPALALKYEIMGFLDSDITRQGEAFLGREISHITSVYTDDYKYIVIVSSYVDEINELIASHELEAGIPVEELQEVVSLSVEYTKLINHYNFNSEQYWEKRYASGGNSGVGSYSKFAEYKANFINKFVKDNAIDSVVEYGCGDGNQLSYAKYKKYVGIDVSETAIDICKRKFLGDSTKKFFLSHQSPSAKYDLALSLDVIYHLIEDSVFEQYIHSLFISSSRYVIIYSSNKNDNSDMISAHVKHRNFTVYIQENIKNWVLVRRVNNVHVQDLKR